MEARCTGANAQWADGAVAGIDQCLAQCETFPAGTGSETSGDSLACRTYHSELALTSPAAHCGHAGTLGGGVCGTACEAYCDVVQAACSTQSGWPFADRAACLTGCAGITGTGAPGMNTGDTVSCRLYHGTIALTGTANDKATHCPHAEPSNSTCN